MPKTNFDTLKKLKKILHYKKLPLLRSRGRVRISKLFSFVIEKGAQVTGPGTMTCGATSRLLKHSLQPGMIIIRKGGRLTLLGEVYIGEGTVIIIHENARLSIGHGTYITGDSRIEVKNKIQIGENCAISWGVTILDDDHHVLGSPEGPSTTSIGNKVWIGAHSMILKNSHLQNGAVIAAKSLVKGEIPADTLCGGVPARELKTSISWRK